jgi:hypothetical protein
MSMSPKAKRLRTDNGKLVAKQDTLIEQVTAQTQEAYEAKTMAMEQSFKVSEDMESGS